MSRIAIVGPAYPYRGGIAQYTDELYEAMSLEADVTLFSFRRLYPSWLYPGSSSREVNGGEVVAELIIDVYNPMSIVRLCQKIEKGGYDAAIITWWTLFWQPAMSYVARRLSKKGIKTVFLCHNLYDHDGNSIKRLVSKKLLSTSNGYIVHSSDEEKILNEIFPSKPVLRRLLPVYNQFPKATKKFKKRGDLEVLFFGFIRPYKGLDVLLAALPKLEHNVFLTIAGEYWGDRNEITTKLESVGYGHIETHLEYVRMEEAANYFERADVVALPYLTATGSAVLSVAYYYAVPVVASSVGGLKDGVINGQTGWLVPPNSSDELAKTINRLDREKTRATEGFIRDFCRDNTWSAMAQHILSFIDRV